MAEDSKHRPFAITRGSMIPSIPTAALDDGNGDMTATGKRNPSPVRCSSKRSKHEELEDSDSESSESTTQDYTAFQMQVFDVEEEQPDRQKRKGRKSRNAKAPVEAQDEELDQKPPAKEEKSFGPHDVLEGESELAFNHDGNRRFHALVEQMGGSPAYGEVTSLNETMFQVGQIREAVNKVGGRFLVEQTQGTWREMEPADIRRKIRVALQQRAACHRNEAKLRIQRAAGRLARACGTEQKNNARVRVGMACVLECLNAIQDELSAVEYRQFKVVAQKEYEISVTELEEMQARAVPTRSHGKQTHEPCVGDALEYLDQVKKVFADNEGVYDEFLGMMKHYKGGVVAAPEMIEKVTMLFRGHSNLILGFNVFLPEGQRISRADLERMDQTNAKTRADIRKIGGAVPPKKKPSGRDRVPVPEVIQMETSDSAVPGGAVRMETSDTVKPEAEGPPTDADDGGNNQNEPERPPQGEEEGDEDDSYDSSDDEEEDGEDEEENEDGPGENNPQPPPAARAAPAGPIEPTINDVLLAPKHGQDFRQYAGNMKLAFLIHQARATYHGSQSRNKALLVKEVVKQVKQQDPPGRFLKLSNPRTREWIEVNDEYAYMQVLQMFLRPSPLPQGAAATDRNGDGSSGGSGGGARPGPGGGAGGGAADDRSGRGTSNNGSNGTSTIGAPSPIQASLGSRQGFAVAAGAPPIDPATKEQLKEERKQKNWSASTGSSPHHEACIACGMDAEGMLSCGCNTVKYCSLDCQQWHWRSHRHSCTMVLEDKQRARLEREKSTATELVAHPAIPPTATSRWGESTKSHIPLEPGWQTGGATMVRRSRFYRGPNPRSPRTIGPVVSLDVNPRSNTPVVNVQTRRPLSLGDEDEVVTTNKTNKAQERNMQAANESLEALAHDLTTNRKKRAQRGNNMCAGNASLSAVDGDCSLDTAAGSADAVLYGSYEEDEAPRFRGLGADAFHSARHFFDEAVIEVALYNYETYYNLERGAALFEVVHRTSAGILGWAASVLPDGKEEADEKKQAAEMVPTKTTGCVDDDEPAKTEAPPKTRKSRGDEEEDRQLRLALLESVGANPSRLQNVPIEYNSEYDNERAVYDDSSCGSEAAWSFESDGLPYDGDFYCEEEQQQADTAHDEPGEADKTEVGSGVHGTDAHSIPPDEVNTSPSTPAASGPLPDTKAEPVLVPDTADDETQADSREKVNPTTDGSDGDEEGEDDVEALPSAQPSVEELKDARNPSATLALLQWYQRLGDLRRYKQQHGDCNVPLKYLRDKTLGIWVTHQRVEKEAYDGGKKSSMTPQKVAALDALGFEWTRQSLPESAAGQSESATTTTTTTSHSHQTRDENKNTTPQETSEDDKPKRARRTINWETDAPPSFELAPKPRKKEEEGEPKTKQDDGSWSEVSDKSDHSGSSAVMIAREEDSGSDSSAVMVGREDSVGSSDEEGPWQHVGSSPPLARADQNDCQFQDQDLFNQWARGGDSALAAKATTNSPEETERIEGGERPPTGKTAPTSSLEEMERIQREMDLFSKMALETDVDVVPNDYGDEDDNSSSGGSSRGSWSEITEGEIIS